MTRNCGSSRAVRTWIGRFALCACLVLVLPSGLRADDASGTEFWLAFEANGAASDPSLQILGASGTVGSVEIPGLAFTSPFSIPAEGLATVVLPATASLSTTDGVETLGVHVTANEPIVVYGLDVNPDSADSYLALPVAALGAAYETVSYTPEVPFTSQFAAVATTDGTQVTITPSAAIGSHLPGASFAVALDAGQVYQAQSSGDLSGTQIVADHPIAVFSGNPWVNVPSSVGYADHLVEQLLPTASWGTDVFVIPSALRTAAERLRIQVSLPNTLVTMSPGGDVTLGPGSFSETSFSTPVRLHSDQPFSVSQFATGGSSDGGPGDPFLLVPTAVARFASCYLVATADDGTLFPDNFVNLVVPSAAVGQVGLDGASIASGSFTAIGATGYSYLRLAIAPGRHRLAGPEAFGASIYGFGTAVSYASPAGGASLPSAGVADCPEPSVAASLVSVVCALTSIATRRRGARRRRSA